MKSSSPVLHFGLADTPGYALAMAIARNGAG